MKRIKLKRWNLENVMIDGTNYFLLTLILILTLYPFYYILILSLNEGKDALRGGIYFWPREFTLENYQKFFSDERWIKGFYVSVIRTVIGTFLAVMLTSLVAFGLSFKDLLWRKVYTTMLIISMYFSGGIIPYYVVLRELQLLNSFAVYVIPTMLNAFFVLIAISFFRSIPTELYDASKMDGANELTIFLRVVLPISKPLLAAMSLFLGVGHWNSWVDSAYFVQDADLRTLSYRLMEVINLSQINSQATEQELGMQGATTVTSSSIQMTAMMIAVVPILCVYPFIQKYFVQGIMLGSVKG